jgi:predicted alpha/beta hydrolase family esterase
MNKQVLFIQGAGRGAHQEDARLVASLRELLGREYEVHYPAMQDENDANYETWARQIEQNAATLAGKIIVVGHSLGASILIRYLAEGDSKKMTGVFLIATPFWGGDKGWKYEGYETLALSKAHAKQLLSNGPLFFYHSRDDEVVPFAHLALYARKFPQATIRELNGRGHQLNHDLSEVAEDIKHLQRSRD